MTKKYIQLAITMLVIQALVIIRNTTSDYYSFFWYCDFAPAFFAIFFLLKKPQAIKGILNIGLLAQLSYSFALVYFIIFKIALLGFRFNFENPFYAISTLIIHLSTLFVLILTIKTKPDKKSLAYSLAFLTIIYVVIILFTTPDQTIAGNFNYIYYSKFVTPYVPHYTKLWIPLAFIIAVLPTYYFQILIHQIHKKLKK